jgi:hypothetical protein
VFTVAYLAFGVPVIIAGQLIPRAGLSTTVIGYCVTTGVVATVALIAQSAVARRGTGERTLIGHPTLRASGKRALRSRPRRGENADATPSTHDPSASRHQANTHALAAERPAFGLARC